MVIRQPIIVMLGHVDHGKCVAPDTLIQLGDGTSVSAEKLYEIYSDKGKKIAIDDGIAVELKDGPEIFSFDGTKIIRKKVSHVWKRSSPKKIVRIALASGDAISVTPEHPFYIANESFIGWKAASEITEKDFVLVPAKLPENIVDFSVLKEKLAERLSNSDSFVVFVDDYLGKEFFSRLSGTNLQELKRSAYFSTDPGTCIGKKRFRIRDFFRLCSLFGFSKTYAYDMIHSIKNASPKWRAGHTSKKMLLPKTFEDFVKLGYIIGCIQGDGCLYTKRVTLHNNDAEVQDKYRQYIKEVFGIETIVVQGRTCKMVVTRGGMTLGRFLTDVFELPYENKSAEISFPDILSLNKDTSAAFIRGWFDTDGYVSPFNNCIEITSKSEKIVKRAAAVLLSFGILSVIYRKGVYWNLRIANKPYVQRFVDFIGSELGRKKERLASSIKKSSTSRVFDITPVNGACMKGKVRISNEILPFANKYFTYKQLSRTVLTQMLKYCNDQTLSYANIYTGESVRFVRINTIEIADSPFEFVYDFSVPDTKNFIAERIVAHNTSLLDCIRKTTVAKKEAGAITQHIGASEISLEDIKEMCAKVIRKLPSFTIPGLLFIDTPGHESFTHLRERGGSIADIAVLVVDVMQGFQPQTVESIKILREFRTPFVVAANKIDLIDGWKSSAECGIIASINSQQPDVQIRLDEAIYRIVAALSSQKIESERYDRISDFKKQVAVIPVSAKTGEGIAELLLSVAGLSQKFLEKGLTTEFEIGGKGSILEVKEEKGLGTTLDVIIYEGRIRKNDEIVFGTVEGPCRTKIRGLLKPKAGGFEYIDEAHAACGVKIYAPYLEKALPGSPILVDEGQLKEEEQREMSEMIANILAESERNGIIVKADTIGSLEALRKLLSSSGVEVKRGGIGPVVKKDVIDAALVASADWRFGVVLGFDVGIADEADEEAKGRGVKIFTSNVVYRLCEDYIAWVEEEKRKAAGSAMERLPFPAKITVLPGCTFRASKPAIFGVEIVSGRLKKEMRLMDRNGEIVGEIRQMQKEGKEVKETHAGEKLAISVEGAVCGKSFSEGDALYSYIRRKEADELISACGNKLSDAEKALLDEILAITDKRRI